MFSEKIKTLEEFYKIYSNQFCDDPFSDYMLRVFGSVYENYTRGYNEYKPLNQNINVHFFDRDEFNASIAILDKQALILISTAIKAINIDLFLRFMAHKKILPKVGNIDKEEIDFCTLNNGFTNVELLLNGTIDKNGFINQNYWPLIPKDKTRQAFAHFLCFLSCLYVFEHELSHYINGHLEYLKKNLGLKIYAENSSCEDFLLKQTFEMDADCTAINRCINFCISVNKNKNLLPNYFHPFCNNIYDLIYYLVFAVNILYWLFMTADFYSSNGKNIEALQHPPPFMRFIYTSGVIPQFCEKTHPSLNTKSLIFAVETAQNDSLDAYRKTVKNFFSTNFKHDKEVFKYSPKHYSKIRQKWSEIRDDLQKFAYKDLAPKKI